MTDQDTLFQYRMQQAEETIADAQKMLESNVSPRSITNRAYYGMFYAILALFVKENVAVKTSKHAGIITIFDREYVHAGKIEKDFSKILHKMFDARQEADYKELIDISIESAQKYVGQAKVFLNCIKDYISK